MKPTTTRPRSSPSAVRQPVWAAQSATRCPAVRYVYQAMRVTGAADPTRSVGRDTLKGKLPQKKLVRGAAQRLLLLRQPDRPGYRLCKRDLSSRLCCKAYGDRRGYGCGSEKRNVIREDSDPGDIIILLGGRTGRDGCGGATGSSKVHTEKSPSRPAALRCRRAMRRPSRKIQRLFRREEVTRLIKKCNDFGAGGVSVAIGELAAGLTIDLD